MKNQRSDQKKNNRVTPLPQRKKRRLTAEDVHEAAQNALEKAILSTSALLEISSGHWKSFFAPNGSAMSPASIEGLYILAEREAENLQTRFDRFVAAINKKERFEVR